MIRRNSRSLRWRKPITPSTAPASKAGPLNAKAMTTLDEASCLENSTRRARELHGGDERLNQRALFVLQHAIHVAPDRRQRTSGLASAMFV
jgi:hypothetical protein